ncbi:hypothetical protein Sphch_2548 [Sphingobium chlorophenolicum L-1]|uniref:Uncharacterized protein n=1 Tax=Sphingobium chlorophenolicum L-1 TaxID=690566 RepID=F6EZA3_SPHCR|nr:hypothetical protein Sphch_2548 [Sphingobium chlorophenolicum L-1]
MHSTISLFDYEPLDVATSMSLDELVAEFEAPYAGSSNRRHGFDLPPPIGTLGGGRSPPRP